MEKIIFGANDSGYTGRRMLAVTGMGGCGKTQIVLNFLRVHRQKRVILLRLACSNAAQVRYMPFRGRQ
jgi:hypothetical protein